MEEQIIHVLLKKKGKRFVEYQSAQYKYKKNSKSDSFAISKYLQQ